MRWPRIPVANAGTILPLGLSRFELGYRLLVPLLFWRRTDYDAYGDICRGWWRFDLCARFERQAITIRWGWRFVRGTVTPYGWL